MPPVRFGDFKSVGEAFCWLGQHAGCREECCRPRLEIKRSGPSAAPVLPPELLCAVAEPDPESEPEPSPEPKPPPPPLERCAFAVFDTETTGLSGSDLVLQCALALFDHGGRMIQSYDRIWTLPSNVKISTRAYRVHKIGYKRIRAVGMTAAPQLRILQGQLRRLRERKVPIVAHNAAFDVRLLKQTADKHGVSDWDLEKHHVLCTMQRAKPHAHLVSTKTGKPKAPSNTELYRHLYKKPPEFGALHDALTDVKVSAACYVGGRDRGWWR